MQTRIVVEHHGLALARLFGWTRILRHGSHAKGAVDEQTASSFMNADRIVPVNCWHLRVARLAAAAAELGCHGSRHAS